MNPVPLINHPCTLCCRPTSMWCSRCQNAWYCTPEHLQSDWPRHRRECIPATHAQNYNIIATPPPAEQQMITVSAILFSPEEERPRIITVKCRPPQVPSQGMCPQPLVSMHFPEGQAESIVLTQGLNGEPLRFPLHLWYSPTALQRRAVADFLVHAVIDRDNNGSAVTEAVPKLADLRAEPLLERTRHHPDVREDDLMDIDAFETGESRLTCPGETITSAHDFMRGHGTYVDKELVIASVAGTVERVNKLVTVRAVRARYNAEVGDLVVGRITEVQPRRWKVDANARQDAVLMLSSVNLPGGVQRRKLESDELQMRTFFEEGDLLVAEVQAFFSDGAMSLHTRSLKYGKLRNGQLVVVPSVLVRRLKSHFIALPCGVDLILGLNGYIWVSKHMKDGDQGEEGFDAEAVYSNQNDDIDGPTRTAISRVSNIIRVLVDHFVPLTDTLLLEAYNWVIEQDVETKDLVLGDVGEALVAAVCIHK
ncbi:hypothetical protein ID866_6574 [Astraeus odoratus]|nr:hypothetical protein ID866_6574 [Astraeus odoratus]